MIYRLTTMRDLLQLDERQLVEVCQGLPRVIGYQKSVLDLINGCAGDPEAAVWDGVVVWEDDGNDEITLKLENIGDFKITRKDSPA